FRAEDGIRDPLVTGVQTCALPISATPAAARTADRGTPRQGVSIAQPEVQSNTATWSVSPSARSSASEKERAPATRPRMSTRQTAKSTEGVGSPNKVVAGGTAPACSQRD